MLKVLYQKLRLKCKGSLNHNNYSNLAKLQLKETRKLDKVGRTIVQGIPILSIFALVGIVSLGIMLPSNHLTRLFGIDKLFGLDDLFEDSNKAYAEEGITPLTDTSASLTVDDGKIKDTIFATSGEFAYASHKITVEANNIKSYSLTLTRNIDLTGPTGGEGNSGVVGANGKTPDQMDNAWGYAFINDGADPTSATYQTLASSNTLSGPAIDGSHNLSGSKQLVFGAKFGSAAASGTYHAEATLSLVATPRVITNYVVNVNCNSGTNCTSTLNTTSDEESYVYTISSTTPTRSGYKFLGYNTSNTTTANANYAPGKTVTLTAANPSLTLYAVWQEDGPAVNGFGGIKRMQDMTPEICKNATNTITNDISGSGKPELYDVRDNSVYTIAKLRDNQCWMTQNLRIVDKTITSADSNVNSDFTIPTSSTSGFSNVTTANVYYGNNVTYGAYYSWCAATAGCKNASSGNPGADIDAVSSVCPKGWRLPKGGTGTGVNDFAKAVGLATTNIEINTGYWKNLTAPSFQDGIVTIYGVDWPTSGRYSHNAIGSEGTGGYYWSRTASSTTGAYDLDVSNGYFGPANSSSRYFGLPVRCVAYSS